MSSYAHVLCARIIVNFICSERIIHSYKCLCDPEDILLIYPDISITLPKIFCFQKFILTYGPCLCDRIFHKVFTDTVM